MCVFNWRSLAPFFVAGLLSGFLHGNLLLVACPHCISILDLYSVDSLILVKNGIDFLNMHIICICICIFLFLLHPIIH